MGAGLQEVQAVIVPFAKVSSLGILEKSATQKLQPSLGEIIRTILTEIDDLGIRAAKAPNLSVFKKERAGKFYPVFVRLTRAMSELLEAKLDESEITGLGESSFTAIQVEVETEWAAYFSAETNAEILFAISALKNSEALIRCVRAVKLPDDPDLKRKSSELRRNYNLAAQWSHFHFEILRAAFTNKMLIVPEVLQEILSGLRFSVMAYAFIRQSVELRNVLDDKYSEEFDVIWDEEDTELANS